MLSGVKMSKNRQKFTSKEADKFRQYHKIQTGRMAKSEGIKAIF